MRPPCHQCGNTDDVLLRRVLNAGGAAMIAWRCTGCDCWALSPVSWLKHETVRKIIGCNHNIDHIPIIEDYRLQCDVCGKYGAQLHHFMPQSLANHGEVAPSWYRWCTFSANLCQYHHDLWHDLVTPWMSGRGNSRKIGSGPA